MNGRDLKLLAKSIPNDAKVKVMIPDRNDVFEPKDVKISISENTVIIEAE